MKRVQAIENIMKSVTDEAVITSCGMISREAYQVKDRDRNFYLMSAMGSELAVGIGLAKTRQDLKVIVISGDGSALMGASTIQLMYRADLFNLDWYILDNSCYASTGGQKTCFNSYLLNSIDEYVDIIEVSSEKGDAPRIPLTPLEIQRRFKDAIRPNSTQPKH